MTDCLRYYFCLVSVGIVCASTKCTSSSILYIPVHSIKDATGKKNLRKIDEFVAKLPPRKRQKIVIDLFYNSVRSKDTRTYTFASCAQLRAVIAAKLKDGGKCDTVVGKVLPGACAEQSKQFLITVYSQANFPSAE